MLPEFVFLTAENLDPRRNMSHVHLKYTISIVESGIVPLDIYGIGNIQLAP